MNSLKKVFILDNIIEIKVPHTWKVERKSTSLTELKFPVGDYPRLGIKVECFDNPKIITQNAIENFLNEGIKKKKKP